MYGCHMFSNAICLSLPRNSAHAHPVCCQDLSIAGLEGQVYTHVPVLEINVRSGCVLRIGGDRDMPHVTATVTKSEAPVHS